MHNYRASIHMPICTTAAADATGSKCRAKPTRRLALWRQSHLLLFCSLASSEAGRNSASDGDPTANAEPQGTPNCADWCSPDFSEHCTALTAHRQCELCDFCIARAEQAAYEQSQLPSPSPPPEDTFAALYASSSKASSTSAGFGPSSTESSSSQPPHDAALVPASTTCAAWCDEVSRASHCVEPRCAPCAFCVTYQLERTYGAHPATSARAHSSGPVVFARSCEPWCSEDSAAAHCLDRRCNDCGFACGAATCAGWCAEEHRTFHCAQDACGGCGFCLQSPPPSPLPHPPSPRPALPPLPPITSPAPPPPPTNALLVWQQASLSESEDEGDYLGDSPAEYGRASDGVGVGGTGSAEEGEENSAEASLSAADALLSQGGVLLQWTPPPSPAASGAAAAALAAARGSQSGMQVYSGAAGDGPSHDTAGGYSSDSGTDLESGVDASTGLLIGSAALLAVTVNCILCAIVKRRRGGEYRSASTNEENEDDEEEEVAVDDEEAAAPSKPTRRGGAKRGGERTRTADAHAGEDEEVDEWDDAS